MEEKKTNSNKKMILIAILIVALIAAVVFIVKTQGGKTAGDKPKAGQEEVSGGALDTPVGELTIPDTWADQVSIEDTSKGDLYSKSFYATVGDKKVLLYELIVGEEGAGVEVGSIPDKNGDPQKVWLNVATVEKGDSLSDDEFNAVCSLQDGALDLINQISEMKGFKKAE